MNWMYDLIDMLENDIEGIVKRGKVSDSELCVLEKEIKILKDTETIKAMRESGYDDYESSRYRMSSRENRHWDDSSYRRGRDSMGRYTSGHDMKDTSDIRAQLSSIMDKIDNMR